MIFIILITFSLSKVDLEFCELLNKKIFYHKTRKQIKECINKGPIATNCCSTTT